MSARVIPFRRREGEALADWSVHTEARACTPAGDSATPADEERVRDLGWYLIDAAAWIGTFALVALVVWLVRWWMSLPREASRWIT